MGDNLQLPSTLHCWCWMESTERAAAPWSNRHPSAQAAPLPRSSQQLLYQRSPAAGYGTDRPWRGSSSGTAFGLLFELLLAMEECGGLCYSRSLVSNS